MSMMPDNPRAVSGDNAAPDYAKIETDRLADEYSVLSADVAKLLAEAREIPERINDDETKGKVTSLIKRLRDAKVKIEGFHEVEKQPHFRRGQGTDQFFFGLWDKLMRRARNNRPGAADILSDRLTEYDNRKLAEEQERRRLVAEQAAREEMERRRIAEEAERVARETREAAERARAPAKIEEKTGVADVAEKEASTAKVEAEVAAGRHEQAHIDTLAKPADIMRQRGSEGTLSTMQREPYALVTDSTLLDKEKLWPFINEDAKEKALRAWAKTTGHKQQMFGAEVGHRNKSVVR